jgi:hypothetical protein
MTDSNGNLNADLDDVGERKDSQEDRHPKRIHFQDEHDSKPAKKRQRPLTAKERALKVKTSEINSTTRWLADSAFTTFFGKPAFHAYGKGNVNPVVNT